MTSLVSYLLLFTAVGIIFLLLNLVVGKFVRPSLPNDEKKAVYECGEPTIGSSWIQFDLRFYVVALLFIIFDVEVAFFFPWAVVFGQSNALRTGGEQRIGELYDANDELVMALTGKSTTMPDPETLIHTVTAGSQTLSWIAFFDILVFFGVLLVGFAYVWKRGDINWVRAMSDQAQESSNTAQTPSALDPVPGSSI